MKKFARTRKFVKDHDREIIASAITAAGFATAVYFRYRGKTIFEVSNDAMEKLNTLGGYVQFDFQGREYALVLKPE